jgi:hypothetical protein
MAFMAPFTQFYSDRDHVDGGRQEGPETAAASTAGAAAFSRAGGRDKISASLRLRA